MARHYYFARLGGGDPAAMVQSGERGRYASMGGVLLGTASVATVSMFFALHHAVGVDVGWSIPLALGWGTLILTIDRFLVITMNGTRGHPFQLLGVVFLRLMLAALIATVVSMPLVLQIFASDINAELPIIAAHKSAQFKTNLQKGALEQQITSLQNTIKGEQGVIDGQTSNLATYYQNQLNQLNQQISQAQAKANTADLKYECERGGEKGSAQQCPRGTTGLTGDGPHALADYDAWQQDLQAVANLQNQLPQAKTALKNAQQSQGTNVASAQQALSGNQTKLAKLEQEYNNDITNDETANQKDTGLLAQIQALFTASDQSTGLAIAHWTVTALFFVIELLPVGVKAMLLIGPESLHDQIVRMREQAVIDKEQRDLDAVRTEQEAAYEKTRRTLEAAREDTEARLQAARNRQLAEYQALLLMKQRDLDRDAAIAAGKARTLEDASTDMQQRDLKNRIKVNKQVARESHNYAVGIVSEWAEAIRDRFREAKQPPGSGSNGIGSDGIGSGGAGPMGPDLDDADLGVNEHDANGQNLNGQGSYGHQGSYGYLPETKELRISGYTTPDGGDDLI
jgi:hypothetical protein